MEVYHSKTKKRTPTDNAWGVLPGHILARLAGEGVHGVADWVALGRRRYRIWGITRSTALQIDELARGTT